MTIQELHYALDQALDRLGTLANPDLNVAEKDWLLNEAQLMLIKQRFSAPSNPKHAGFENTTKRIADLSTLVVKFPKQPALSPIVDSGVLEVDLTTTIYPFLFLVSAYADVTIDEDCTKQVPLKFTQHDDLRSALRDPFFGPSLEFLPFNLGLASSSNFTTPSLYIYPGDFTVPSVYVEYIRRPKRVSYGNYQYKDGVTYAQSTLELPDHLHLEVVDLAAQIAALSTQNPEYVQLRTQKLLLNE